MRAALTSRKERLCAKRKILEGKHCVTVATIRDHVKEAQKATKKKKAAKGKKGSKCTAEVLEESSDNCDSYSEQESNKEVKILDCIEVEF